MISFPIKHLGSRLKTHSRYFQWSPGDYATLKCSHDFKQPLKQQFCDMISDKGAHRGGGTRARNPPPSY